MAELLQGLSDEKYDKLRKSLEKDIEELEGKLTKVQIIVDLLDKKEQLIIEIADGRSRMHHECENETIYSSREDNIDEEPSSWA